MKDSNTGVSGFIDTAGSIFKDHFKKCTVSSFLITILFIVAMCIVISYKANYFVDEFFTYEKANYSASISYHMKKKTGDLYFPIEDGKIYYPGGKALMDYVVVQPEHRFDYANVWKNEAKAVHPPFHSALGQKTPAECAQTF